MVVNTPRAWSTLSSVNLWTFLIFFEFSSQLEESIDSWRAELVPTVELVPHQQFIALLFLSIWLLKFLSLQVTPQRILKSRESHQDICNLPSEETKSSTPWSRLLLLVVVSFLTFIRLWSWNQPRKQKSERIEIQQQMHVMRYPENLTDELVSYIDCAVSYLLNETPSMYWLLLGSYFTETKRPKQTINSLYSLS